MADKVERDDVAAVAAVMAKDLWVAETGSRPKASEANFLKLVAVCALALKGSNPSNIHGWVSEIYPNK